MWSWDWLPFRPQMSGMQLMTLFNEENRPVDDKICCELPQERPQFWNQDGSVAFLTPTGTPLYWAETLNSLQCHSVFGCGILWGNLLGMYFGSDLGQGELTWPENKSRQSQAEELLTTVCNTIKWGDQTRLKPWVTINPRRNGNKKNHSPPWQRGHFLHWQNSEQGPKSLPQQHF